MTRAEVCAFLRAHDDYVILTHRRPDGDTIGSAAALCLGLRAMGKRAGVLCNQQFTPRFAPFLAGLVCEGAEENATVISADIASTGLLSFDAEGLAHRIALAIDHHGTNSLTAPKLVEADKAACGEIIFDLLTMLGVTVTKEMADCLYVAISTDTGCFKYSNTSAHTLHTAAALVEAGADTYPINKLFFDTKSFARLQLESRLTASMTLYAGGLVGLCSLPNSWLSELAVTEDDIDSISGFARSVEGVEIGIMLREVEGGNGKISLRTGPAYNAAELCGVLGGGGHAAAAGATVPGGIEGARCAILSVLRDRGILKD